MGTCAMQQQHAPASSFAGGIFCSILDCHCDTQEAPCSYWAMLGVLQRAGRPCLPPDDACHCCLC